MDECTNRPTIRIGQKGKHRSARPDTANGLAKVLLLKRRRSNFAEWQQTNKQ